VPKEDKLVGAPSRHIQVLHFMSMPNCQTHERPCALRVAVDQVVDDHACRHTGSQ